MNTDGVAGYAMGCLGVVLVHGVIIGLLYVFTSLIGGTAVSMTLAGVLVTLIDIGIIVFLFAKKESELGTAYLVGTALLVLPLLIIGACIGYLSGF